MKTSKDEQDMRVQIYIQLVFMIKPEKFPKFL